MNTARNLNYDYDYSYDNSYNFNYEYDNSPLYYNESSNAYQFDYGYDYYDTVVESFNRDKSNYYNQRYAANNRQAPILRILNIIAMIVLALILASPFALIVYRNAKIHEAQNDLFKLSAASDDYKVKTNEIKEKIESNMSLDDLETYALEQMAMVKANSSRVIILDDKSVIINEPDVVFSLIN